MSAQLDAIQTSHLKAGIEEINEGRFWHAHEDWDLITTHIKIHQTGE
ncbi:MAG: DUF309 domain-containing protein [Candidatus Poseidoniaceae archaeon]|jgi:predicted transcriptional regulator|nr:DUF309 domain-containing protein [Candidatus Poseidoniaceae archaeon]MDP7203438.1 DUF309 domain-containing protein [Candidatus Poseidoniaceae archaeon]